MNGKSHWKYAVLTAFVVGCGGESIAEMVQSFPERQEQLDAIASQMKDLRTSLGIVYLNWPKTEQVMLAGGKRVPLSEVLAEADSANAASLLDVVDLARGLDVSARINEDGTVRILLWSGGALGPHAGYYFINDYGLAEFTERWSVDKVVAIASTDKWVVFVD